jgi:hypothetical protein
MLSGELGTARQSLEESSASERYRLDRLSGRRRRSARLAGWSGQLAKVSHPQQNGCYRLGLLPYCSPYGNVANVNVPVFIGAGAVSVNVLDEAVFSPNRASPVPEAEIAVMPPEIKIFPVPVAVWVPAGTEYWV